MSESELSHRGLMKMANAKLDYMIKLNQYERFIIKNGETSESLRYLSSIEDNFKDRVKQIYAEDKTINLERNN